MPVQRGAVVGVGLIGGSLGAALRRLGYRVRGYDRSPEHLAIAMSRELIDETATSLADAVAGCDLVLLALPVLSIVDLLPAVGAAAPAEALILDTGSVKRPVVEAMARVAQPGRAVGGHPIAGKELAGPAAADPDLFAGCPFALCPSTRTDAESLERAGELVNALGAVPLVVEAAHHDEVVARTSHLPQLLSTALALSVHADDLSLAGSGFADMTRLAASDPVMWRDIMLVNGDEISAALARYLVVLSDLADAVAGRDAARLDELFSGGAAALNESRVPA